jgi:uncharacterized protein YdhG (YjbR/CyaY superfamily)
VTVDTVADYLEEIPGGRGEALGRMRAACRELLLGFDESIQYGMPSYARDGVVEVAFANQKRYISLYVLRTDVLEAHERAIEGIPRGKGCLRFSSPARIDWALVRSLHGATRSSRGVC